MPALTHRRGEGDGWNKWNHLRNLPIFSTAQLV
jgi:hypothetical protein